MEFKEFVKRSEKYLNVIRSIGKDEFYQEDITFEVNQGVGLSSKSLAGAKPHSNSIIIWYNNITRVAKHYFDLRKQGFAKNFHQNYSKGLGENLYDPVACGYVSETEFIKNVMIECYIHELLHLYQYQPLFINVGMVIDKVNERFDFSDNNYMKYIEIPNQYKTTCFIIDHKEELYERLGYNPFTGHELILYILYLHYNEKPYHHSTIIRNQIKWLDKSKLKEFYYVIHSKFMPYKKASIGYKIALSDIKSAKSDFEGLKVNEIKSKYIEIYRSSREKVTDYYKNE